MYFDQWVFIRFDLLNERILVALCLLMPIQPGSKVHGANMEPIWDRQDPGGPHVGPMNIAIWDI